MPPPPAFCSGGQWKAELAASGALSLEDLADRLFGDRFERSAGKLKCRRNITTIVLAATTVDGSWAMS